MGLTGLPLGKNNLANPKVTQALSGQVRSAGRYLGSPEFSKRFAGPLQGHCRHRRKPPSRRKPSGRDRCLCPEGRQGQALTYLALLQWLPITAENQSHTLVVYNNFKFWLHYSAPTTPVIAGAYCDGQKTMQHPQPLQPIERHPRMPFNDLYDACLSHRSSNTFVFLPFADHTYGNLLEPTAGQCLLKSEPDSNTLHPGSTCLQGLR